MQHKKEREGLTPEEQQRLDAGLRNLEARMEDCRRMQEMGLRVITGSDSSWGDYQLGNTVYEAELLVACGYSAMKGVLSVTGEAAKALAIDDVTGTLEPGKEADIIVVDGNPAEDINALWNVDEVFMAGQRVGRGSPESVAANRQMPPRG